MVKLFLILSNIKNEYNQNFLRLIVYGLVELQPSFHMLIIQLKIILFVKLRNYSLG